MSLFGRRSKDPRLALAAAIAKRGVRVIATVESLQPVPDSPDWEIALRFSPEGEAARRAVVRQPFNDVSGAGLAPGEPAEISYDRDDPAVVLVWGSPKVRVVDGVPVPVAPPPRAGRA